MTNPNFFPEPLRRVVGAWDYWQQVAKVAHRTRVDSLQRAGFEPPEKGLPIGPRMSTTGEFGIFTPQVVYIVAQTPHGYRIDVQDRGTRSTWAEISDFYDVEKFLIWRLGDIVRREYGLRPLSSIFYEAGMQTGTRAEAVDLERTHLVRLFLRDDPQPRAILGPAAVVPFSHVIQLELEELNRHLHVRIIPEALQHVSREGLSI